MSTSYGVNTTIINNDDGTKAEVGSVGGTVRCFMDTIAAGTGDIGAADIIHMADLPSNAKILSIKLFNDDLDSATTITADVGLYNGGTKFTTSAGTAYAAGAVIDDDCYATAITDFRGAVVTGTEVAFEARNISAINNFLWEDAGLPEDPKRPLRLCLTIDAAGDTAGDISIIVQYMVS